MRRFKSALVFILTLGALAGLALPASAGDPLGSGFTFQGELQDQSLAANGSYDFQFEVFDAVSAGNSLAGTSEQTLQVENGIFTAQLDFGDTPFVGDAVWLEVRVRAVGGSAYTTLSPRQAITSAPYALHAQFVGTDAVSSAEIKDGSVTGADMAAASIGSAQIIPAQVQRRITTVCSAGQFIRSVAENGTADCANESAGPGFWTILGDGRIESAAGVRIQPNPAALFPFTIRHDSALGSPHIVLTESETSDYARMNFYNDGNPGRFWAMAARVTGNVDADRFNIYNSGSGGGSGADLLSIHGTGRVGISFSDPQAMLAVKSEGNFGPGISNGRGDFYVGDGTLGLSIGIALGGGGAGTSRIWSNTQGAIVLGNTTQDVMSIGYNGDRVGVGTSQPQQKLHISGGDVRIDQLAHAGPGSRTVEVEPDGDLVLGSVAVSTGSVIVGATSFQSLQDGMDYRILSGYFENQGTTGGNIIIAPISLPVGATVTAVTAHFIDNSTTNFTISLNAYSRFQNEFITLATINTSGADPATRESTDNTIHVPVVNADYFYEIFITTPGWTDMKFRAVKVSYTQ